MLDWFPALRELAWPLALAIAWAAGELVHRLGLPRITAYALAGFACSSTQLGLLPAGDDVLGPLLANIAFGLILFEFAYRTNLRWFRHNPWLAVTGVAESLLTALCVYAVSRLLGAAVLTSALLATVAMATSPATLTRVAGDLRSSGQVTERALHLSLLDCVLAGFLFKVVVAFWSFQTSGNLLAAFFNSAFVLLVSAAIGTTFGAALPLMLRLLSRQGSDGTLTFAVGVIVLVAITHALKLSPLVGCLAFGLVARHRRVMLNQAQRNFGALGDLLAIFLFVAVAAAIDWQRAAAGLGLGLALVVTRALAKLLAVTALARASGTSWRKGALTAVAMTPFSTFAILLVQDTRYVGLDLVDALAPLAAAALVLAVLAPLATQAALRRAGEAHDDAPPPGDR